MDIPSLRVSPAVCDVREPCKFDSGLASFDAGIHRQELIVTEHAMHELLILSQYIYAAVTSRHLKETEGCMTCVECSGCQRQFLGLLYQCLDNLLNTEVMGQLSEMASCMRRTHSWMTVSLIEGRVAAQAIVVPLSINIPDENTATSFQHDGQGFIVVCAENLFAVDHLQPPSFNSGPLCSIAHFLLRIG